MSANLRSNLGRFVVDWKETHRYLKKQFALILELLPKKGMQSKQDGVKFYAKLYKCICLMGKHIYLNY